jgi:hypothetical protein
MSWSLGGFYVLAYLWQLCVTTSFKIETMGMMVQGNTENSTIVDHRRPITNVKSIVGSIYEGQLPNLPAEHHAGRSAAAATNVSGGQQVRGLRALRRLHVPDPDRQRRNGLDIEPLHVHRQSYQE